MIEFKNVTKEFGGKKALDQLNLQINNNELFVLVGESGSGKTTSLKMLNRLIEPTTGAIEINGRALLDYPLQKLRLGMGYVLQNMALFPNLTVEDNIGIQLEELKWSKSERIKRAHELLELVNLDVATYAKRFPNELSGGEQQRVGIVRALANNPEIILMDEPFSALDPLIRKQLQDLVLDLHQQLNNTIVFVTHDMAEAVKLGTRIAVMRNGHLQQVGSSQELIQNPANEFVKSFFKSERRYPVLVKDLVKVKLETKKIGSIHSVENLSSISRHATLAEFAQELEKHPEGMGVSGRTDLILTSADVMAYLAKKEVSK